MRFALAVSLVLASVAIGLGAKPRNAEAAGSAGSATTVSGTGEFSGLKVTVSQTVNLTNQVVRVSWTGGAATQPATGDFYRNYLQIMQCWGDDTAGPSRTQCQYGGSAGDTRGGNPSWVTTRQVNYGTGKDDPSEPIKPQAPQYDNVYVPFDSVTGKTIPGGGSDASEFFDGNTTNEVPFARTGSDGTGEVYFEIQTALDAPGLGCGTPVTKAGATVGRPCWLVVVPRGDTDVNGVQTDGNRAMYSSPLESSVWNNRIVVPLTFQPIAASCKLGADERSTLGQEAIEEAISRWQPQLCATTGSIFGYSQVSDDAARSQLLGRPQLSFVSDPVPATQVPADEKIVYAPIAANATVIAFNIDSNSSPRAPAEIKKDDGKRLESMNLDARLVAKLLTQSYRYGLAGTGATEVGGNPTDLISDNEFLALNPGFKNRQLGGIGSLLLPVGNADAISVLWKWIAADADAKGFIDGKPDPYGMVVNPNYKRTSLALDRFPKNDLYCQPLDNQPALCELDAHPYAADGHEAARSASRGDTLSRNWDPNATPPVFKKAPNQLSGAHAVMSVTDAATAARYDLPTARLRNAAGKYVPADTANLLAAVGAMKPVTGTSVLAADPSAKGSSVYPLTTLTYASTVPARLDAAAAKDYKAFVDYAVGAGQTPGLLQGQLPAGYAPLPASLRTQARSVASAIVTGQAAAATPTPTTEPGATPSPDGTSSDVSGGGSTGGSTGAASPQSSAAPGAPVTGTPTPGATAPPSASAVAVAKTSAAPVGAGRLAVLAALVLGIVAAVSGPVLLKLGRRAP